MTRYEYVKNASLEEMAKFMCELTEHTVIDGDIDACDVCRATKYCHKGHNGFLDWLQKEANLRVLRSEEG